MVELSPEEKVRYEMLKAAVLSEFDSRQEQFRRSQGGYWIELEDCMWAVQALRELSKRPERINNIYENVSAGHIVKFLRKEHEKNK